MTQSYVGQIQPFGFGFAPKNWAQCNGQLLSISQNAALFSLLGTMYGGNGVTTFALPELQSRVPMHAGNYLGTIYSQGEEAGVEQVSLDVSTLPLHTHAFMGTSANATANKPADGVVLAQVVATSGPAGFYYAPDTTPQPLASGSMSNAGGNLPHNNLQPFLTINWCICLYGLFPSRN